MKGSSHSRPTIPPDAGRSIRGQHAETAGPPAIFAPRSVRRRRDVRAARTAPEPVEADGPGLGLVVAIDPVFEIRAADEPGIAEGLGGIDSALPVHHAIAV